MQKLWALRAIAILALASSPAYVLSAPASAASEAGQQQLHFTSAQSSEIEQRWVLATQIVARIDSDARLLGLGAGWRQATMTILLGNSSAQLLEIAKAASYQAVITAATRRDRPMQKALGDPANDLVFKPFTPCRYLDTRNVGGKISGIRAYDLANNGSTYGGDAGCDPKTLAGVANEDLIGALAANVTIVDTSSGAPGFVAMRPAGSTVLSSLVNWYIASASTQDANAGIIAINQSGPNEFEINTSGPVHVIVDLLGAFISPTATALDCITVQSTNGNADQAPGTTAEFSATCTAGYQVTGGGCHFFNTDGTPATESTVVVNRSTRARDPNTGTFLNAWACQLTNNDPVKSFRFGARSMCCRTPGR